MPQHKCVSFAQTDQFNFAMQRVVISREMATSDTLPRHAGDFRYI
jgi:hypothetical protein